MAKRQTKMKTSTLERDAVAPHPIEAISPATDWAEKPEEPEPATDRRIIRILLADDHPVVRMGIASCLADHPQFAIVGEASCGREAVSKARALNPDLVLMDADMPGMSGIAATQTISRDLPHVRILILSIQSHSEFILRILESGASGLVLKESSPEELVQAIETVSRGESFFSSQAAQVALNQFVRHPGDNGGASPLTRREREVLTQIAEGLSNKEIASVLNLGIRTVETHRERLMTKLNIHTIAGLTRFAIAKGYVTLGRAGEAPTSRQS
jgi:two-component system nitrate/nitrite response regulator NarL